MDYIQTIAGGPLAPGDAVLGLKPFLKWAGGKRWLASHHKFEVPKFHGTYYEPFLGGGAVFFDLLPSRARISDANPRLIETYVALRDAWADVAQLLDQHHSRHCHQYYYEVRKGQFGETITRAAQFIYLNRACWNGLYRVNKKGEFNVPIGSKNWIVSDSDDFEGVSRALQNAEIICCDFRDTIRMAGSQDFIFADPPYTTAHNFNGFVKYNENIFSWNDQISLRDELLSASKRDARFFLTNADHNSIDDLYSPHWNCERAARHSVISGQSYGRSSTSEIFVRNYGS